MDCDTTGIEPDFAIVKFKKLAGGGYFKIINRTVPEALRTLGYNERGIEAIIRHAVGHGTLEDAPGVTQARLNAKGRKHGRGTCMERMGQYVKIWVIGVTLKKKLK